MLFHLLLILADVPGNVKIIENTKRGAAIGQHHELDAIMMLKRFASDQRLSQDISSRPTCGL